MKCETCGGNALLRGGSVFDQRDHGFYDDDSQWHFHGQPKTDRYGCWEDPSHPEWTEVRKQPCGAQGCKWGRE